MGDAIEAKQVEGEAPQQGEEAGVSPNATGILAQGHIPNIVETVLDAPMGAGRVGGGGGRSGGGGYVVGGFLAGCPVFLTGIEHVGVALDFDQGAKMSVPILGADTER